MLRKLLPALMSLCAAMTITAAYRTSAAATTRGELTVRPAAVATTVVAAPLKRHVAMRFALSKAGGWYNYGGNGPRNYDCSGLTTAAYAHAGISLPRVAADQRYSGKTVPTTVGNAHWGDLVFWGTGHVELFGHRVYSHGHLVGFYSFGAHHTGTRISYRYNAMSSSYTRQAHLEYVAGAGAR